MAVERPQVLIVDDEPRNIRLLEGVLYAEPYHILIARSGQEALEIMLRDEPDLILLDIMMPGMNGFEVCQQIKSMPTYRTIPVVMVTALHEVHDRIRALEAGADDFLSKPIDATELIARVRSLVKMRQLQQENEQLAKKKLAFMAGLAHDIRTLLNALSLNLEQVETKLPSEERNSKQWSRILSCVDRIEILAKDIMNYYKTESKQYTLNLAENSVGEVIQNAVTVVAPIAEEKSITLDINCTTTATVFMDQDAISQVLLNLLTNAIKYSFRHGTVILNVYDINQYRLPVNHSPPILALPTEGVVFEVIDKGQGIHREDFDRVFSEFERINQNEEGIGLGLAVSQRLVRLHQGEIWFTSEIAQGSIFAFFLPKAT